MKRSTIAALRSYGVLLIGTLSWRIVVVSVLMLGVTLSEGATLLMLVPLLQALGIEIGGGGLGRVAAVVDAGFTFLRLPNTIAALLVAFLAITGCQALLYRWHSIALERLQQTFILHLRQRLYYAIIRGRWLLFVRSRVSDLAHALAVEINRAGSLTHYLLSLLTQVAVGAVYVFLALQVSVIMTVLALGSGGTLILGMRRIVARSRSTGEEYTAASRGLLGVVSEHLGAMKIAKSYAAEDAHAQAFGEASRRFADIHVHVERNHADARVAFKIGSALLLSGLVYVSIAVFSLSAAEVLLLLVVFSRLVPRFSSIQTTWQHLLNVIPSYLNVSELLERFEAEPEPRLISGVPVTLEGEIRFDRVTFSYNSNGNRAGVRELSLVIPARRTTAIVGASGSGKTTIADLVAGLITPESGTITIDGMPLQHFDLRVWRQSLAYVGQDTLLFHESIKHNLLWARPKATEEELWESLRMAAADQLVRALPAGMDTMVGDRGAMLSGGERQRIALARALLRKPSLLILDEATSALDPENEHSVWEAIRVLSGIVTVLVITHRLSTIEHADVIHVVESGKLVESGTWAELMANGGRFATLNRQQPLTASANAGPAEGEPTEAVVGA